MPDLSKNRMRSGKPLMIFYEAKWELSLSTHFSGSGAPITPCVDSLECDFAIYQKSKVSFATLFFVQRVRFELLS